MRGSNIFGPGFLEFLKTYVDVHHSIYPTVPPQEIYFEALVERTFRAIHKPLTVVKSGGVNQPRYDIQFEGHRISLKTETGLGTKRTSIIGKRVSRQSLAADVVRNGEVLYRVHFDGSDGKCSIRNLRIADCDLLLEWEKLREPASIIAKPDEFEI